MWWLNLIICFIGAGAMEPLSFTDILSDIFRPFPRNPREGRIPDYNRFDEDFDFIVVGAGSAGCVLANRLTENPKWKVLLLEAGGDENFFTDIPIFAPFASITNMNWGYVAEPEPMACRDLRGNVCSMPRGKVMGGSSVLNFLLYSRGHPDDYDDWANLGLEGWSYKDVLPYFKKSENIGIPELMNSSYHGRGGYLDIQYSPHHSPLQDAFRRAGEELGYPWNDPNGEQVIGFSKPQATMRNGRRCSSSKAFLEPIRHRPNLRVSKYSTVTKILIEPNAKRAYGVEFTKRRKRRVARASREVVLAAGTVGSAQLLMVSGVGPAQHLRSLGLPVLLDLPVGDNLQDHITFSGNAFLVNRTDACVNDMLAASPASAARYMAGNGPLTLPGGAAGLAFVRTAYASSVGTRPDMELVLGAGSLAGDTLGVLRALLGVTDGWWRRVYGDLPLAVRQSSFALNPVLLQPRSVGSLRLRSPDPRVHPAIQPNYFSDRNDLYALREGVRMVERVVNTTSFRRINATLHSTPFPGCEHLTFRSDAYWECAIIQTSITLDHQVGTCSMGSDGDGVVTARLRVHGARGLRVADASVMPRIPTAHTHAPVLMIAEKAADMIKEDWAHGALF